MPQEYEGRSPWKVGAVLFVGALVLWAGGSYLYWVGEGRPGSPDELKERVAARGLEVQWTNAGPRGGNGTVETDCGPLTVMVSDFDGELWVITDDINKEITPQSIDALIACEDR